MAVVAAAVIVVVDDVVVDVDVTLSIFISCPTWLISFSGNNG